MERLRNEDDRISKLPVRVLHHIQSFLPTRDGIRTCVLSKTWNSAWYSFPVLVFDQYDYFSHCRGYGDLQSSSQDFFSYVNSSIARRQNISIQKLSLPVLCTDNPSQCEDLDRLLSYATSNNVEHLLIYYYRYLSITYTLPTSLLFRTNSLKELDLMGLKLASYSVDDNNIACFSLKILKLSMVYIDEPTLQSLLSKRFACLEEVSIRECEGFQSVSLCGTKLMSVTLDLGKYRVEKITIEAPNLRFLSLGGECANDFLSRGLEATQYIKNLKKLMLYSVDINDAVFRVIQEFEALEKLTFYSCRVMECIRISSCQSPNLAVSDTTTGSKNGELVAECIYSHKQNESIKLVGLYKLGIV